MKFNEKLIKLRKEAGLSQEELENKLNVARQTYKQVGIRRDNTRNG